MRLIYLAILLVAIFSTFSCTTYKLGKNINKVIPYQVNDILVFESIDKTTDTIKIKEISKYTNPSDPLCVFCSRNETLFITHERSFLEIDASQKGVLMEFSLDFFKSDKYYPSVLIDTKEIFEALEKNITEIEVPAKEFYDNMKGKDFDLEYIVWDLKFGYKMFKFKSGKVFLLKNFYRNNEDIYNTPESVKRKAGSIRIIVNSL